MLSDCPVCGAKQSLEQKGGVYKDRIQPWMWLDGESEPGVMTFIPKTEWQECRACGDGLLPAELCREIEIESIERGWGFFARLWEINSTSRAAR